MTGWKPGDEANGHRLTDDGQWVPVADQTQKPSSSTASWALGTVVNSHILTESGWVPFKARSRDSGPPWDAGDVVDGHVLSGAGEWMPVPVPPFPIQVPGPPSLSLVERWDRASAGLKVLVIVATIFAFLMVIGLLGQFAAAIAG